MEVEVGVRSCQTVCLTVCSQLWSMLVGMCLVNACGIVFNIYERAGMFGICSIQGLVVSNGLPQGPRVIAP